MPHDFEPNEKIQHPGKPDWGVGTVLTVQKATHEGKPCQRLTVRFDGAGKKTINTAFAELSRLGPKPEAAEPSPTPSHRGQSGQHPLAPQPSPVTTVPQIDPATLEAKLGQLPDALADPFRDLENRLTETLASYRFQPGDRTLLEWATAQTGLTDPLSLMSRHELEEHFTNFRIRLDKHLKMLLEEARRTRLDTRPIIATAPAGAQQALRRINPAR